MSKIYLKLGAKPKKTENRISKLEQDLGSIMSTSLLAPNARISRLESLKSKLDGFAQEIRNEQQVFRDRIKPVLQDQHESLEGISFAELAAVSEQEADDEAREVILVGIQNRIAALRKNVKNVLSKIVD